MECVVCVCVCRLSWREVGLCLDEADDALGATPDGLVVEADGAVYALEVT